MSRRVSNGDAAALLGNAWNGFYFQNGELFIPGWKYGFNPYQVKAMFFQVQQVRALENELRTMQEVMLNREFVGGLIKSALKTYPAGNSTGLDVCHKSQAADEYHQQPL